MPSSPTWLREIGIVGLWSAAAANVFLYTVKVAKATYNPPPLGVWGAKGGAGDMPPVVEGPPLNNPPNLPGGPGRTTSGAQRKPPPHGQRYIKRNGTWHVWNGGSYDDTGIPDTVPIRPRYQKGLPH